MPSFLWKIQLTPVYVASGSVPVTVTFDVMQPDDPRTPKSSSGEASFSYKFSDASTRTDHVSQLTITNLDFAGVYNLEVLVSVSEIYAPDEPTLGTMPLLFDARTIRYEDAFYRDQFICAARFKYDIPLLVKELEHLRTGPIPPVERDLSNLIAGIDRVREVVAEIGRSDPSLARNAAIYAGLKLSIDPHLLMQPGKNAATF